MAYLCKEYHADGAYIFFVDSLDTYNTLVDLSEAGSNEAEEWGGFEFHSAPVETERKVVTMKDVTDAMEDLDDADEDAAEEAYMSIMSWAAE